MTDQPHHPQSYAYHSRLWGLAVALVLAAFVLRMVDLQRRPLHFDEGINVTMGHRSPAGVLALSQQTFDNDPPGHRFAMGVWMALAGPSPLSIRIFSVFFSLLAVAITYRLCRQMRLGFWPTLLSAGLVAALPYSVDYAQQAKGYAMGIGMAMLSWWMWIRLNAPQPEPRGASGPSHRRAAFLVYVLSTALALGTHYYTILLLPMQWLWFFGVLATAPGLTRLLRDPASRRNILQGPTILQAPATLQALAAQVIAFVPIGLWLALMAASLSVSTVRSSSNVQRASVFSLLTRILGEMSAGQFADPTLTTLGALALAAALLVGALRLWRQKLDRDRQAFWFGIAALLPLAGALALQQRVTFFFPRFLLFALPGLCVLAAGCLLPLRTRLPRLFTALPTTGLPVTGLPVIALAGVLLVGLIAFYTAPIDSDNDYRPVVSQVRPYIQPGDAALGTYIWMEGLFTSYAPETAGALQWHVERYATDTVGALMEPIAQASPRVWSVNFRRDPDAPATLSVQWLKQHAAYAGRFTWGTTNVLLFDTHRLSRIASGTTGEARRSVTFGDQVRLDYAFSAQSAHPGDTLLADLEWSALRKLPAHTNLYLHLMSPQGQLVAQNDSDAVNGLAPAFTWEIGKPITDRRAVLVGPLPPGDYMLVAGVYRTPDGAGSTRLLTSDGRDGETIGVVHITPTTSNSSSSSLPLNPTPKPSP